MTVTTRSVRHELDDFFRIARPFDDTRHMPILALVESEDGVQARAVRHVADLLGLPDETVCVQPWPGRTRTDLFTYTVGQARAHMAARR